MKRSITERELENITMANYLMFLSQGGETDSSSMNSASPARVFECKTCNRQFPSFQALGGHRASHKKPKLTGDGSSDSQSQGSPTKPKTHECTICGLEFAIGQALGGHMRRHRAALSENHGSSTSTPLQGRFCSSSSSSSSPARVVPVVKKTNSSRRVLCLDLNLTPLENDIKILQLKKTVPLIDCLF